MLSILPYVFYYIILYVKFPNYSLTKFLTCIQFGIHYSILLHKLIVSWTKNKEFLSNANEVVKLGMILGITDISPSFDRKLVIRMIVKIFVIEFLFLLVCISNYLDLFGSYKIEAVFYWILFLSGIIGINHMTNLCVAAILYRAHLFRLLNEKVKKFIRNLKDLEMGSKDEFYQTVGLEFEHLANIYLKISQNMLQIAKMYELSLLLVLLNIFVVVLNEVKTKIKLILLLLVYSMYTLVL